MRSDLSCVATLNHLGEGSEGFDARDPATA